MGIILFCVCFLVVVIFLGCGEINSRAENVQKREAEEWHKRNNCRLKKEKDND